VIEGKSMRGDQDEAVTTAAAAAAATPADVLPGAAAEPKAEWELQLEAEEQAEREKATQISTGGGEATPAGGTTTDQTAGAPVEESSLSAPVAGEAADPNAPDEKGDEPGDLSHPRPQEDANG
jgi:hypothetical protein